MKFDNENLIEQTNNTHVSELEPMYWIIEDALRDGKIDRAKSMLHSILYVGKYKPKLLLQGLQVPYRERLKTLTHELFSKQSIKKCESIILKPPIQSCKIPFKLESELKNYLVKHPEILSKALEDSIKITGTEVETEGDYRCDIVAESSLMFYAVELKITQGNHSAVSQCSKYCYYFYRQLRYDRFKTIQGIVIALGFDKWSINELRREGHWIFFMKSTSESDITLERIL